MSIISEIPEALQSDKDVVPFIVRANEMASHDAVLSYYCKVYVLEHILNNKLHTKDKEVETFTIQLLDHTEQDKADENLSQVLDNKTASLSVVFSFGLKLFNQSLNGLNNYKLADKQKLAHTIKVTINFLSLVSLFDNETIDFSKVSGGKQSDFESFNAANKERIKLLKYQLSRLMKDEIPSKEDGDLEEELEQELQTIQTEEQETSPEPRELPSAPQDFNNETELPNAPSFIDDEAPKFVDEGTETDQPALPVAPHFSPEDESGLRLPGAPKFLPDDDISHINKNSGIHMIPKGANSQASDKPVAKTRAEAKKSHAPISPHKIELIIDKEEAITKIQKHAKFAISALNYEDLDTAEKELIQGLELIRLIRQGDSSGL